MSACRRAGYVNVRTRVRVFTYGWVCWVCQGKLNIDLKTNNTRSSAILHARCKTLNLQRDSGCVRIHTPRIDSIQLPRSFLRNRVSDVTGYRCINQYTYTQTTFSALSNTRFRFPFEGSGIEKVTELDSADCFTRQIDANRYPGTPLIPS